MERLSRDEVICAFLSHCSHIEITLEARSVGTRMETNRDVTIAITVITAGVTVVAAAAAAAAIPTVIATATAITVTIIPDIEKYWLKNRYARLCYRCKEGGAHFR